MPAMDWAYTLRDGTVAVADGEETGDWVRIGQTPLAHTIQLAVHLPTDGAGTITLTIQQADDDAGTNSETVPAGNPGGITDGAETYFYTLQLTRPYIRFVKSAGSGADWGGVKIGIVFGGKPKLP